MRNFKKVMALAVSAAALATSVSAFAELEYNVEGLTGAYEAATNSLSLTVDGAAGDKTVLVLANGVAAADATGDDILYINQYTADETAYAAMGLKGTDALPAGEYAIKIGYTDANGDFAIADGKIVVTEKTVDEPKYITVIWGDIDSDGSVAGLDAAKIVSVLLGNTEDTQYTIGEVIPSTEVVWGDIDSDGSVAGLDAAKIVSVLLGNTEDTQYTIGTEVQIPVK
jgi:hypothetical protein